MIHNISLILDFYKEILPITTSDEVLFMFIQARRKYNKTADIKDHDPILSRKILKYRDVDLFLNKVEQLDALSNTFISNRSKNILPKDSMVIYVDLCPKSTLKAFTAFTTYYINEMKEIIDNDQMYKFQKMDTKLNSFIHKSNSRKPYFMLDLDTKNQEVFEDILNMLPNNSIDWITETRGGFHYLINKNNMDVKKIGKLIYKEILPKHKTVLEVKGQAMTVLPGTVQGGWKTRRIEL